jgi:VanZ family protein
MVLIPGTTLSRRLAIAFAILMVAVSSFPDVQLPSIGTGDLDKLLHVLEYGLLGFLVARGWGPWRAGSRHAAGIWIPAMILLAFAAADEYHQHWIPGRWPEWWDWAADTAGIVIGYTLGALANRAAAQKLNGGG